MASANEQLAAANLANLHEECNIPQRNLAGGNVFGAGAMDVLFGNNGENNGENWSQVDRDLDNLDLQCLCPINKEFPGGIG
jgi:hypothetical protein